MTDSTSRTAGDLTFEEWKRYHPLNAIRKRQIANHSEISRSRRRAISTARKAVKLLRRDFGAQRVVLFGSLAKRGNSNLYSDIDLAAWGIPPRNFYAAVAAVTGISSEYKIDLVDPDSCRPVLRASIEEGIEL